MATKRSSNSAAAARAFDAAVADVRKNEPRRVRPDLAIVEALQLLAKYGRFRAETNGAAIIFEALARHGLAKSGSGLEFHKTALGALKARETSWTLKSHAGLAKGATGVRKGMAMGSERKIYEFWNGKKLITAVVATSKSEARAKADRESMILADRPFETPHERKVAISNAHIVERRFAGLAVGSTGKPRFGSLKHGKHYGPTYYVVNQSLERNGKLAVNGEHQSFDEAAAQAKGLLSQYRSMRFDYLLPVMVVEAKSKTAASAPLQVGDADRKIVWLNGKSALEAKKVIEIDPRQMRLPGLARGKSKKGVAAGKKGASHGRLTERQKIGEMMQHWHSSGSDPIYAVGSFFFADKKYPDPTVVVQAEEEIQRLMRAAQRGENGWKTKEAKELQKIWDYLNKEIRAAYVRKDLDPAPGRALGTFFDRERDIRVGDVLWFTTPHGTKRGTVKLIGPHGPVVALSRTSGGSRSGTPAVVDVNSIVQHVKKGRRGDGLAHGAIAPEDKRIMLGASVAFQKESITTRERSSQVDLLTMALRRAVKRRDAKLEKLLGRAVAAMDRHNHLDGKERFDMAEDLAVAAGHRGLP